MSITQCRRSALAALALAATVAFIIEAPPAAAHSRIDRPAGIPALGLAIQDFDAHAMNPTLARAGLERAVQLAGYDEDDRESTRPSAPAMPEVRGHEQNIEVRRRSATPIPRTHYSRKKKNSRRGRRHYSNPHYYHYYHGHTHHSHCGHAYWDYGDAYESRTLGRSCIYGTNGEVIYKPADIICAPDESATPAAQPAARPDPPKAQRRPAKTTP